jgi:hypothetical protein
MDPVMPENEAFITPFILQLFLAFISFSRISFVAAASAHLTKLVHSCIELGRRFPSIAPDSIFPSYNRTTLSRKINTYGEARARNRISNLIGREVSVIWDAGKGYCLLYCCLLFTIVIF